MSLVGLEAAYPKDPQFSCTIHLLRYGNTIWGFCDNNLIDKLQCLQNRVCRIITGIGYENADHPSLLKELGLLSIRQLINLDLGVLMF